MARRDERSPGARTIRFSAGRVRRAVLENFLETRLPEWREFRGPRLRASSWTRYESCGSEGPGCRRRTRRRWRSTSCSRSSTSLGTLGHPRPAIRPRPGRSVPDYAIFLSDEARRKAAQLPKGDLDRFRDAAALAEAKEFERPFNTRRGGRRNEDPTRRSCATSTRRGWAGASLPTVAHGAFTGTSVPTQGQFYEVDLVALLEAASPASSGASPPSSSRQRWSRMSGVFACSIECSTRRSAAPSPSAMRSRDRSSRRFRYLPRGCSATRNEPREPRRGRSRTRWSSSTGCCSASTRNHGSCSRATTPTTSRRASCACAAEVAEQRDGGVAYSERSDRLYSVLRALFRIVDEGEPAFGVNAVQRRPLLPDAASVLRGPVDPRPADGACDRPALSDRPGVRRLPGPVGPPSRDDLREAPGLSACREKAAGSCWRSRPSSTVRAPTSLPSGSSTRSSRARSSQYSQAFRRDLRCRADWPRGARPIPSSSVCDPAAGSGHFLVAAVEYIAHSSRPIPAYGEAEERAARDRRAPAARCGAMHLRRRHQSDGGRAGPALAVARHRRSRPAAHLPGEPPGRELDRRNQRQGPPRREASRSSARRSPATPKSY